MEDRGTVPIPSPQPFRPKWLANWLGASVAMLAKPVALCYYPDTIDETIRHGSHRVAVKIEHRFDSADVSDPGPLLVATVMTRLTHAVSDTEPYTLERHISETLFDYQLHSAIRANAPWIVGPDRLRPDSPEILGGIRRLRTNFAELWMPINGMMHDDWLATTEPDEITGVALYGVGGLVGRVLVAAAGPATLLGDVEISMIQPDRPQ